MTNVQKIRKAIKDAGGIKSFSSTNRKTRPIGCPMKNMMKESLQTLSNEEIHIAFRLGLIGNERQKGSIVENSKK